MGRVQGVCPGDQGHGRLCGARPHSVSPGHVRGAKLLHFIRHVLPKTLGALSHQGLGRTIPNDVKSSFAPSMCSGCAPETGGATAAWRGPSTLGCRPAAHSHYIYLDTPPICHTNLKWILINREGLGPKAFLHWCICNKNQSLYRPCACIMRAVSEHSELRVVKVAPRSMFLGGGWGGWKGGGEVGGFGK